MTLLWRISSRLLTVLLLGGIVQAGVVAGRVTVIDSAQSAVSKHHDYSGVVVWLEPRSDLPEGFRMPPPGAAEMVQKDKKFLPHVLAIQQGALVNFPNLDPIFHNAFSTFAGQPFDVGLYPPGTSRSVRYNHAGIVHVFCTIHSSMSAVMVVVPSAFFATTREDGEFEIANVPEGRYRLRVFHERALPETLDKLERDVVVQSTATVPDM